MTMISKILLIDDDETSNFITEKQLKRLNVSNEIITVLNGLEAKNYVLNCVDLPPLALVDINMPIMTGFEFLDWFEHSKFKGQCKFSIYSTSIRMEDREKANQFSDVICYIEKPLTEEKIHKIFQAFPHKKGQPEI